MKKFLILPFLMLLTTGILFLNGCGDSGSSSDGGGGSVDVTVTPAAEVTIDDIKSVYTLNGAGSAPTSDAATEMLMDDISAAENSIDTAIESAIAGAVKKIVSYSKTSFNKNLKNSWNSAVTGLTKSVSQSYVVPQRADRGSDSWNETDTIILGAPDFTDGTVDYTFVGSYSWSENYENVSPSIVRFTEKNASQYTDKLTFNNVVPSGRDITLNGNINDNYKENFTSYVLFNTSTGLEEEISLKGGLAGSYRSGFAVSGNTVKCYVVISLEIKAKIDAVLNGYQIAGKTPEEKDELIDDLFTLEGGATVKVYNESGELEHTQTLTAEEIW